MPWSEWVQSANQDKLPGRRRHIQYSTHAGYTIATDLLLNQADTITGQGLFDPPGRIYEATQYDVPSNWDELAPIPPEFGGLEFGVDYDIKPGADLSDPFRYVQYDPDDHAEVVGWFVPAPVVLDRDFFDQSAVLWLDRVTAYPAGLIPGALPVGVAFATVTTTDPVGTVLPAPPDPGNTLSFTIGISPDFVAEDDTRDPTVAVTLSSPFFSGWPFVTVRPQRWRYWIPFEPPLQQRRRDDGLGLAGVPSARGQSSRQFSNRAGRGYYF